MSSLLRTEGVEKVYRTGSVSTFALRGVTLRIEAGSFTCLVGPSGHGKSTLLHILGALDSPTSGKVFFDGEDISRLGHRSLAHLRAARIGTVFQFFNLLPSLTAEENVETALMFGQRKTAHKKRAAELLDLVGLGNRAQAKPWELSGGQQQRVAIARALANDPPVLLMDEPTGNLDSETGAEILGLVEQLHRSGKTIVIVTHSDEVTRKADHVLAMKDGRIMDGLPAT